ncbi:MAG: DNA adenine methylase [Chloroflexi bacterium]|nr:DNA adenine methylase [Chloroflexota bacterium]
MKESVVTDTPARPFLKWAGGKGRLLSQIEEYLPPALSESRIRRYVEPFVGGGALFFYLRQKYDLTDYYLFDRNPELILVYRVVRDDVEALLACLQEMEADYLPLAEDGRKAFYYQIRQQFNEQRAAIDFSEGQPGWAKRAAQLIFMNRTGYNGLFRVNSKGAFNVPFGRYKNPAICRTDNLRAASQALQGVHIEQGEFTACEPFVDERTFVYFDPPYRPLSATAHFTAYAKEPFGDVEQLELARFYGRLHQTGAYLMLSNADPRNTNPDDTFFEDAYYGFRVERIQASRAINSRAGKRGPISELLIMNY